MTVTDLATPRTQAARVASMRARLLDATIESLVAGGHGQLSTNDIVRRAGVSRGALAHHFPTKAELLAAAAEHLVARRVTDFRSAFLALAPRDRTVPRALDLLWSFYEGPTFMALLDLTIAARTNPDLRRVLRTGPDQIAESSHAVFIELFPEVAANPQAEQMVRATLTLFAGMAVQVIVDDDAHGHHRSLRQLVQTLGAALVPDGPP